MCTLEFTMHFDKILYDPLTLNNFQHGDQENSVVVFFFLLLSNYMNAVISFCIGALYPDRKALYEYQH